MTLFGIEEETPYAVKRHVYRGTKEFDAGFFYTSAHVKDETQGEFVGKFISDARAVFLLIIALFGASVLSVRALYLQVVRHDYYAALAEGNRVRIIPLPSARGIIYDADGTVLVENKPTFDALVTPIDVPHQEPSRTEALTAIATIVGLTVDELQAILADYAVRYDQGVVVKEAMPYEDALRMMIEQEDVQGLSVRTRINREYIYSTDGMAHLLGYIGRINRAEMDDHPDAGYLLNDYIGKNGLEQSYETLLRGTYGTQEVEVDARGKEKKTIALTAPHAGSHMRLSLDSDLQKLVYATLTTALRRQGLAKGAIVVMDPQTGKILALASAPDYDNNLFVKGISQEEYSGLINDENNPLFNRAIKGTYPSGSTIKVLVGAQALDDSIITPSTGFTSTGGLFLYDRWFFPDWRAGGHGYTTLYKAIADSVNTYFYIVGGGYEDFNGLGERGLAKAYTKAGLGSVTGIDLPSEAKGLVPTPEWKKEVKQEDWYIGDTYHMAIGQGDVLVTPIQVAQYTAIFANGGKLIEPSLVQAIVDPVTNVVTETQPVVKNEQVYKPESIAQIKRAMRETVLSGSAPSLQSVPVDVAGKTGTAQWHPTKGAHAWFTGFAPYDNPEIVVTVLVEEGKEGSTVAVPIARDIMMWYFTHRDD